MTISRILVAVDGSEPSLHAVDLAALLARSTQASLELVSVLDLGQLEYLQTQLLTDEQLRLWHSGQRRAVLDEAHARLPKDLPPPTLRLLHGRAATTLVERAKETEADLIVIGRTGKGAVARLMVGSVSRKVSLLSDVPVLQVP